MLLFQILPSLAMAAVAVAILMRISAAQVPSFDRVAPRYLKAETCSSGSPFMVMLEAIFSVLLTMTLDFSVLTSIPYALALVTNLSVSSCSSLLLPPIKSMSSAKRRLQIGLPLMVMEVWGSWRVVSIILSRKMLKSTGESRHPCLTPTVVWLNLQYEPIMNFKILACIIHDLKGLISSYSLLQ